MSTISARYAGRCYLCGRPFGKGDRVRYNPSGGKGRKCCCIVCERAPGPGADRLPFSPPAGSGAVSDASPAALADVPGFSRYSLESGAHRLHLESLADCLELAGRFGQSVYPGNAARIESNWTRADDPPFFHGYSFDGARAGLQACPPAILRAVDSFRAGMVDMVPPARIGRRIRRGLYVGAAVSLGRYVAGRADCWRRPVRVPVPRRVVSIGVNCAVHCSQDYDALLWRGAAAAALADVLTAGGLSVQVDILSCLHNLIDGRQAYHVFSCTVKRPDMPMDLGGLAFSVAEIGFYRRVVVPALSRTIDGPVSGGFGRPSMIREAGAGAPRYDYLLEKDIDSAGGAREWFSAQSARAQAC